MTAVRRPALLAGLVAVLALSACGVPPSDVIQAGEPATGMPPGVTVFFLASDGSPVGLPRETSPGLASAVDLVFEGPTRTEAATVSTRLPRLPAPPKVVDLAGTVLIQLPQGVAALSRPAMRQLVCTAATAYTTFPMSFGGAAPPTPVPTAKPAPADPRGVAETVNVRVVGAGWSLEERGAPCATG